MNLARLFAAMTSFATISHPLTASTIVFSNFQGNALLCGCDWGQGLPLGAIHRSPLVFHTQGFGFSIPQESDYSLDRIEIPVGLISGPPSPLLLFLHEASDDGSLGEVLESFQIDGPLNRFGQDAPPLVADSIQHPILSASNSYWLLATMALRESYAGWYISNIGDSGPYGVRINDSEFCCIRNDLRAAFTVWGTPTTETPEPQSFGVSLAGLLALLLSERRWGKHLHRPPTLPVNGDSATEPSVKSRLLLQESPYVASILRAPPVFRPGALGLAITALVSDGIRHPSQTGPQCSDPAFHQRTTARG